MKRFSVFQPGISYFSTKAMSYIDIKKQQKTKHFEYEVRISENGKEIGSEHKEKYSQAYCYNTYSSDMN